MTFLLHFPKLIGFQLVQLLQQYGENGSVVGVMVSWHWGVVGGRGCHSLNPPLGPPSAEVGELD